MIKLGYKLNIIVSKNFYMYKHIYFLICHDNLIGLCIFIFCTLKFKVNFKVQLYICIMHM